MINVLLACFIPNEIPVPLFIFNEVALFRISTGLGKVEAEPDLTVYHVIYIFDVIAGRILLGRF